MSREAFVKPEESKGNIKINHIFFVLDDSGSMSAIHRETVNNFNETVQSLKKNAKGDQANLVSLVTFGNGAQTLRPPTALSEFTELKIEEYNPKYNTPLYDGIGYAIAQAEQSFDKYKNFDNAALLFILTDGQENASLEYNQSTISQKIKDLQSAGRFTFTFMGCSNDMIHQARALGIYHGNTILWQPTCVGINQVMTCNADSTQSYFDARSIGATACSGFYSHTGYHTAKTPDNA